jgi:hypothetical protein
VFYCFLHFSGILNPGKVYTIVSLAYFIYAEMYLTTEIPNRRYFEDYSLPECYTIASYLQFGATRLHGVTSKKPFS